jgi:hypothetical protein
VNRVQGEAISESHRRNHSWAREHQGQLDEAWFKREIAPKLDAFTLAEIAGAAGLSVAACSPFGLEQWRRIRGIGNPCENWSNRRPTRAMLLSARNLAAPWD